MKKLTTFLSTLMLVAMIGFNAMAQKADSQNAWDTRAGYNTDANSQVSTTVPADITKVLPGTSANGSRASVTLTKQPDAGPGWFPLSPTGTYVYANSFVSIGSGTPTTLGMWLMLYSGTSASIRFEVWGDNGGLPDPSNVLATTGSIVPAVNSTLQYFSAPVLPGASSLVNGVKYWYVGTCVGESGDGRFQTGGHTQNSTYNDNGVLDYSNDPNGINFDGLNRTPEIAFSVTIDDTPPATPIPDWALYFGVFLILVFMVIRYRRLNYA